MIVHQRPPQYQGESTINVLEEKQMDRKSVQKKLEFCKWSHLRPYLIWSLIGFVACV